MKTESERLDNLLRKLQDNTMELVDDYNNHVDELNNTTIKLSCSEVSLHRLLKSILTSQILKNMDIVIELEDIMHHESTLAEQQKRKFFNNLEKLTIA